MDLEALRRGDKSSWDAFVARYAGVVHAAVARILGRDGPETEDAAQEVFVRLIKDGYRLLRQYDPARASLVTFLSVVARSTALDRRRALKPTQPIETAPEPTVDPVEPARLRIPAGLLTPRQALILSMLYDRDLDPDEVGRALGIDAQTVRSQHHKALTRLRAHFGDDSAGAGRKTRGGE